MNAGTINGYAALKMGRGRYGINDLRGAHVVLDWQGRTLLGTIVSVRRRESPAALMATVRHFNGAAWPLDEIAVGALRVLDRSWT